MRRRPKFELVLTGKLPPLNFKVRANGNRYHVPEHLAPHIDYITPGIKLIPVVKRTIERRDINKRASHALKAPAHVENTAETSISAAAAALPPALQNCSRSTTKACIQALYSIPDAPAAVPGNSLGLFEQGSYFAESDINLYYANFAPEIPQNTFPINASIDGGSYSVPASAVGNSGEANIDIEMAYVLHRHFVTSNY